MSVPVFNHTFGVVITPIAGDQTSHTTPYPPLVDVASNAVHRNLTVPHPEQTPGLYVDLPVGRSLLDPLLRAGPTA